MKLCAVFRRSRAARWETPLVALAIVELMIDVPVEMIRPVVPRASAYEYSTAAEPLGPIIAIRSAIVRRGLVMSVRATRRCSDADCNLCMRFIQWEQAKNLQQSALRRAVLVFSSFTFRDTN